MNWTASLKTVTIYREDAHDIFLSMVSFLYQEALKKKGMKRKDCVLP